jgi:hypothetical protein
MVYGRHQPHGRSGDEAELKAIVHAIEASEAKPWPLAKRPERAGREGLNGGRDQRALPLIERR